ncbi:MAG: hypothetical protein APF81_01420 [Desulfosporosinus sp. BRH_c37]|nr:MAG: hypothetical protein APF81_01420 [Desulfosporosinus sp. BRH_c37]
MDASLDTNVIFHLYNADFQDLLFNRFEKLKVYEFIRTQELKKHADSAILEIFDKDVESGKIELVTDAYLREIGMFSIFLSHVKETRILFEGSDLGEVYAISMAKTLGCISLVTDDIKERGPHYTLMRIPDSDVMPFAFYELLFLDYLEGRLNEQELLDYFNRICVLSKLTMDSKSKLKSFIKRFWRDPYTESEKEWMKSFCEENGINAKNRIQKLSSFLLK